MWIIDYISIFRYGPQDLPISMTIFYLILLLLIVLIILIAVQIFFPKLEKVKVKENLQSAIKNLGTETDVGEHVDPEKETNLNQSFDTVMRILEPDERRVIETLINSGGTMLQKDISWELGFSRVKTHRILVKLLKRGLVTARKYYNTNRINLVDWLTKT